MYHNADDIDMPPPPIEVLMQTPRTSSSSPVHYQRLPKLSVSTPTTGMRSQRRQPFSAMMDAFPPNTNYHRWGDFAVNLDNSLVAYETTHEFVPEYDFERFTKRLQSKLAAEQIRLREAKAQIPYWRKKEGNRQSWNEICARALLLLSEIRIETYRSLISRVTKFHQLKKGPFPLSPMCRSTFTLFRVEVDLCREYYMKNMNEDPNYVFILVGSTNEKTIASELMEVIDGNFMRTRRFYVEEEMVFKNLPLNFRIYLSLYAMKVEHRVRTPKAIIKKAATNLISRLSPSAPRRNASFRARDEEDGSTGFELAGRFVLSRSTVGSFNIQFDNKMYPLDGAGDIHAKVSSLPHELYAEVTGVWKLITDGEISTFYAKLTEGIVNLYEDEMDMNVKYVIDCSSICNRVIEPLSGFSDFPYSFALDVTVFHRGEEEITYKNYIVKMESKEELQRWIKSLNDVLAILRDSARINEQIKY